MSFLPRLKGLLDVKEIKWIVLKAMVICVLLTGSAVAQALEFETFLGTMDYQRLSGCCTSSGGRVGAGLVLRTQVGSWGLWDLSGYSDRRWTEGVIMKPFYLLGSESLPDPSSDSDVQVRRLSGFRLIGALGGGVFSHSTRTVAFDLPALTGGTLAVVQLTGLYAFTDRWSLSVSVRSGLASAPDDRGLVTGGFFGLLYRAD